MFSKQRFPYVLIALLPLMAIIFAGCAGENIPLFSHQGRLLDNSGNPVADGSYNMQYRLYNASSGGTAVYTDTQNVAVEDGLFTVTIGDSGVITPSIFADPTYMELTIDGETLTPRQRLLGAPYAFSLVPGAVVQGTEPITRTVGLYENTGAAMSVLNTDATATGGNGLAVFNQAAAEWSLTDDKRSKVAALQAIAAGGDTTASPPTGAYGAKIISENYRGLYVDSAPGYFSAVFNQPIDVGPWLAPEAGGCIGCTISYISQNVGTSTINPGDYVAVAGVMVDQDLGRPIMLVHKANSASDPIIGIAGGAMERSPVGDFYGTKTGGYDPTGGPAESGAYLSVVVQGLVQANVGADSGLLIGDRITLSEGSVASVEAGQPAVGRILSEVDRSGFAWVMFNGQ